jgi:hypothetical protein
MEDEPFIDFELTSRGGATDAQQRVPTHARLVLAPFPSLRITAIKFPNDVACN